MKSIWLESLVASTTVLEHGIHMGRIVVMRRIRPVLISTNTSNLGSQAESSLEELQISLCALILEGITLKGKLKLVFLTANRQYSILYIFCFSTKEGRVDAG